MTAAIKEAEPDFVYASYCGAEAADFVRACADARLSKRIPLVGSGFLVDDDALSALDSAAPRIISVRRWVSGLSTPENVAFGAAYREQVGRPADVFAVLGYDTARLILEAANAAGGDVRGERFGDGLARVAFASPRGQLTANSRMQSVSGPLYLCEAGGDRGTLANVVVTEMDPIPELDVREEIVRSSLKTGWLNAYLSV